MLRAVRLETAQLHTELTLREALAGEFDVLPHRSGVRALRRRRVPSRGLFRLLVPRVVVTVGTDGRVSVRPNALAVFMTLICLGGMLVELTMPRAKYPREYPAAFPFALGGFYLGALGWEWTRSRDRATAMLQAKPP